jgi:hypothetical protein
MANNKIQLKRTTISGRTPNTTNSGNTAFIDAGELAVNLTDQKVYSSNGTVSFEVGANLVSLSVGSIVANGTISVTGDINLDGISVRDTATTTTTATTQTTLIQYPTATYNTGEFVIQAVSSGVIHTTKMLVVCNTTTAIATEFASLLTGSSLFSVDCDISAANTRIRITPASATSTTFKASYELITA